MLQHQVPVDIGRPISMIVYDLDHPKGCGDSWIGAYSKHGFWYEFFSNDYQKIKLLHSCFN